MKYFYFFLLLVFSISETIFSQNYQLVWSDEFDGTSLDQNSWTKETGGSGWGNNELEYYTDRDTNCFVQNGILTIKAIKENYGNRSYTSARIKTQGKRFFKYGKIEARMKLPYSQGIWPAFWLLGENINSVGWPACGETDIMEMIGGSSGNNSDKKVYGTAHWDDNGHAQYGGSYSLPSGKFADDFHTFAIVWDPQKITWYVDDKSYVSVDITSAALSEFQNEFFIILNLAVGGNWPGNPDATTVFPQTLQVDYVRVYKDLSEVPDINIINPIKNSVIDPGTSLSIDADIQFEGTISKVDFFQGSAKIGVVINDPYQVNLYNVSPGCYNVYVVAYTDKGFNSISDTINFNVGSDCVEAPYKIVPANIPGEIEAENFNSGGQGTAYNDNDAANNGGAYRPNEGVDIQDCTDDGGGYNVGWLNAGEWMDYLVNVIDDGMYCVEARVSSGNTGGGTFHIEFDGVDKTGAVNVPNTGGWQTWTTVVSDSFALNSGTQKIRFVFDSGSINLNNIGVYHPNSTGQIEILSPIGGESWQIGTTQEIRWNSAKVSDVKIGLSTDGGSTWSFISGSTTSEFGVYRWKVAGSVSDKCQVQIVDSKDYNIKDISKSNFSITNTTEVNVKENKINKFFLMQNYPNPFNPITKIKYSVPSVESGYFPSIQLSVYNVLGVEVASLVNQKKPAGEYEVNFDGSKLPSGVYYYRLQAGSFSQTKKLILLK